MRLRNVKGSREQIAANEYTIKDAEQIKGRWKDYFQDGKPIQFCLLYTSPSPRD